MSDIESVGGDEARIKHKKEAMPRIILGILAAAAVLLTIGVIVLRFVRGNVGGECLKKDSAYDIETCVTLVYEEHGKDDAMKVYERAIDDAYDDGNEELFYELLMERANALVLQSGDCRTAVNSIEDERVNNLSTSESKGVFYSEVIGLAITCNEDEMEAYYKNKLIEINNSGEIEANEF